MRIRVSRVALILLVVALASIQASAQAFDLSGPTIDVRVTRGDKKLPISQVPNLKAGDRLWIHPDLPQTQSARYLLVVVFLRGATNPPPNNWFTVAETWKKPIREEGIVVEVPAEAQQAVMFLAPETGGDFSTLRTAVRGRPGIFVRAAQDLQQLSLDRARLDRYLKEIRSTSEYDPKDLHDRSVLLARSLSMKLDPQCFDKPSIQQASCLTQNADRLVLDDAHSQSMVAQLASGATADLMNQIGYSRLGGGGAYSPYIGALVDIARILGGIHSAQYQYIPALAVASKDSLHLRLNNPPSFRNPKSVLVVALPPVQEPQAPPLRPVDEKQAFCAQKPSLVLPVEGAPLVYATNLAHNMVLRVEGKTGQPIDVPVEADPVKGGFVVDTRNLKSDLLAPETTATLQGMWGFDPLEGPKFRLRSGRPQNWSIPASDETALIVGRKDLLHLEGENLLCVSDVELRDETGKAKKLAWKASKTNTLEIEVPLNDARPSSMTLLVSQHGAAKPDEVPVRSYAEPASLERFNLNSGDTEGVLVGTRLDDVVSLSIGETVFQPVELRRVNQKDELTLKTAAATDALRPQQTNATVALKDGRKLDLLASVAPPRPKVALLGKGVQYDESANESPIRIDNPEDLPITGRLIFSVKSVVPVSFPRSQAIELAVGDDDIFRKKLSISDGSLVLQDSQTVIGVVDLAKAFGISAFGPLRFRPVDAAGIAGDWQPLGTLIRLPEFGKLRCPKAKTEPCVLTGTNLFFIAAVADNVEFNNPVVVPQGSSGNMITVPHPKGESFYLKLRDNPNAVQTVTMPVTHTETPARLAGDDPQ